MATVAPSGVGAHLAGARHLEAEVAGPSRSGRPGRRPGRDERRRGPAPTTIVFGTDGWRAKIADDYTFENVRRCADGVATYVVERGEGAKGVVVAYDRRFASEHFAAAAAEVLMAHDIPVAFATHAVPTQMSSFEVVERGAAAGIVITASHNPWTDNGFKVKAPTGAAAGHDILAVIEAQIARNGGDGDRATPVRRRRGGGPRRAVRSVRGLRAVRPPDGRSRCPQGRRLSRPRRPHVRRRRGLDPAAARRAARSGSRRSTRSGTRTSAGSTPSRSGRTSTRRSASSPGAATTLACCSTATRTGPARPTSSGTFIHQLGGHRAPDVLPRGAPRPARTRRRQRQQHVDGRAPR